jgi:hypothetical protein
VRHRVDASLWVARLLIALVVFFNLQAALAFLLNPEAYTPGFELSGIAGMAALRGIAVLFIMWNIPYLVALSEPRRNRRSLFEALAMQAVGLIGESTILFTLPAGNALLHTSILRFVEFDLGGLVALGLAAVMISKRR